jgi:hypothetical protein
MLELNKIPIHDSVVLGYEVDAEKCEIRIRTEYRNGGGAKTPNATRADVIFCDVAAYSIVNDSFGTILFDIEEVDPFQIIEDNWESFERGYRASGWPGNWAHTKDAAIAYLKNKSINGYSIGSSIGLSGWVLAKSLKFISHE